MNADTLEFAKKVVHIAQKKGADQSEVYVSWGREFSVTSRNLEVENLKQATSAGVGLRVIRGGRLGFGYTSSLRPEGAAAFVERVIALAGQTAVDPHNTLPAGSFLKKRNAAPAIYDEKVVQLSADWKIKAAVEMEKVALGIDPRIKTIESVGVGDYLAETAIVTSEGLIDEFRSTYIWAYCVPFVQDDSGGQTDYWQDVKNFFGDLDKPENIAKKAAHRALRMLGADKIDSGRMPVLFDPNMAKSFFRGIVGAINGDMIYKKASFLLDKRGEQIASDMVTVVDDGTMNRGIASAPFDGEGVPTTKHVVVDRGVLKMYLYDTYTANKAQTQTTGNAVRGYSSLPSISVTNFYLAPGKDDPDKIIADVDHGLYVTKMMGRGANTVNGDFSRGANGILIEKGKLTRPVQEVTVAGNMLDMMGKIDAVGTDIDFRGSLGAPTIRFSELAVSGK